MGYPFHNHRAFNDLMKLATVSAMSLTSLCHFWRLSSLVVPHCRPPSMCPNMKSYEEERREMPPPGSSLQCLPAASPASGAPQTTLQISCCARQVFGLNGNRYCPPVLRWHPSLHSLDRRPRHREPQEAPTPTTIPGRWGRPRSEQ
jgi:hypothetical protein